MDKTNLPRLTSEHIASLPAHVERPDYDRDAVEIGVVHFGPGAFHRVHQAAYFDALLARDPRWAISVVSLRSAGLRDALAPQDGLYTLAILDAQPSLRLIGAFKELLVATEQANAVRHRLAAPTTRIVSLTVTEKGYCLGGDGRLDFSHPEIVHDLAAPAAPVSAIGWLVEGLRLRHAAGLPPFVTLSCDNLTDNGVRLRAAVLAFAERLDPALATWIEGEARFPSTMVDSITPATDDALRDRVATEIGLWDAWPVQREAFTQWVIEDDLGSDAPDLASVGATLTDDVRGFEQAKLRLLNGAHSSLAYLGLLLGRETVAEAMADPLLSRFIERLMTEEIAPTIAPPRGLDVPSYITAVLGRFRNGAIRHNLAQIAWDGSQKLPYRLLGTIADTLEAGRSIAPLCLAVAAWMRFVAQRAKAGIAIVDPLANQLAEIGLACDGSTGDVARFLALGNVFPTSLAADPAFRRAVTDAYVALERPEAALSAAV